MADSTLLEQYKALIGVVAFPESGKPLAQVDLVLVLTVAAFAIVVCHVWMKTLAFYRGLFGVKLQLLGEMEKELAFPAFSREHELMKERGVRPLIDNELWVPRILWVFFAVIAATALTLIFVDG